MSDIFSHVFFMFLWGGIGIQLVTDNLLSPSAEKFHVMWFLIKNKFPI